jgi:hypothetical protein
MSARTQDLAIKRKLLEQAGASYRRFVNIGTGRAYSARTIG